MHKIYKELVNLGRGKKEKSQGSSLQIQMLKLTELDLQTDRAMSTWFISANESKSTKNIQDTTLWIDNRNLFALNMLVGFFFFSFEFRLFIFSRAIDM